MKKFLQVAIEVKRVLAREKRPRLDIPELENVTQKDMLELVDWELKQAEERQKLFGVGSWSLLVALAGTVWATASLPALSAVEPTRVALAFVLLESTLAALRTVWTHVTRSPEASDVHRAMRTSIVGGTDTNVALALGILQSVLLLVATMMWGDGQLRVGSYCVIGVLCLSILGNAIAMLFLRLDMHIIVSQGIHSPRQRLRPGLIILLDLALAIAVPAISWGWVNARGRLPQLVDFEVAGLLVAVAYLLRQLLSSQAQARHQDFLRHLRRDLVLGFETPRNAAVKLAWRLSGFPVGIYVKGRFRALTNELKKLTEGLRTTTEQMEAALRDVQKADCEAKEKLRTAAGKFLADQLEGSIAGKAGMMGHSQAEGFLALAGNHAKSTEDYKNWDEAHKQLESAGKQYEQIHRELKATLDVSPAQSGRDQQSKTQPSCPTGQCEKHS